jgi:carbon-monoxide dehydrogenase large subunit
MVTGNEERRSMGSILGNRVQRVEDPRFLTYGGQFIDDITFPDEAWVVYVRSPYAHAKVESIDISEALTVAGVLRVYTAADLEGLAPVPPTRPGMHESMSVKILAADTVRFVGEAVVAVVAETKAIATDAAQLVIVEYEPLTAVVDVADAIRDDVLLFPDTGSNSVFRFDSEGSADFSDCEVVVAEKIVNQRLSGAPMEARIGAAYWTPEGRLVHYTACQGSHRSKTMLEAIYRLEPADVRVIIPDVGGGFGVKSRTYAEEAALGFYSRELGRPVRWTEDRSENFLSMPQGRGQVQNAKLGGTREGKITAYQLDVIQDAGAYPMLGALLHQMTMRMTCGVYDIKNVGFTGVSTVTNAPAIAAYRGAGRPEASVAIERMIDRFAHEIGLDPVEVRRQNMIPAFDEPIKTGVGETYDVGNFAEAMNRALAVAGYDDLRAEQNARRAANERVQLGIGLCVYVEITAGPGGSEFGAVELHPDGTIVVRSGATPFGQGHETTWAMIVADRTGVPIDQITVLYGDTDEIRSGAATTGSRSVQIAGTAIAVASAKLVDQALQRAASLLEASVDDIVHDADRGAFHVAGTPARSVSWGDLAVSEGDPLAAEDDFEPPMATFPFGCHIAVVEVDTETGATQLRRMIACDDAGNLLNPMLAEGQIHGGIAQGVAQALLEEVVYDSDGTPKTTNFADYPVISAAELPSFELTAMATPTWVNELGAKGVGESGTIGAAPAVYNSIIDAVSHLGVTHLTTPCTPEKIWQAINSVTA